MNPLSAALAASPELFPCWLDPAVNSVSLTRLSKADYEKASFLDQRIIGPQTKVEVTSFANLQAATAEAGLSEACDFIFHIGHVGSTLLSRLLGRHPALFSVREPAVLRTLAQIREGARTGQWDPPVFEARLSTMLKLWSRTFRPAQKTLLKATSFVSELAPEILSRPNQPKAIFMTVSPANFLASVLGAENSPKEAQIMAPARIKRLNTRIGSNFRLEALSIGEIVAMTWACEMTALASAMPIAREQAFWLDFDRFLTDPGGALSACFTHLKVTATPDDIERIISGPDMSRYSKAQEYEYDADLRGAVIHQAHANHGEEIRRGLKWLSETDVPRFIQSATSTG